MRNSTQQSEILIRMRDGPVGNIAELARQIGSARSSVSRTMHALNKRGLVYVDSGERWHLTQRGEREAASCLDGMIKQRSRLARRLEDIDAVLQRLGIDDMAVERTETDGPISPGDYACATFVSATRIIGKVLHMPTDAGDSMIIRSLEQRFVEGFRYPRGSVFHVNMGSAEFVFAAMVPQYVVQYLSELHTESA